MIYTLFKSKLFLVKFLLRVDHVFNEFFASHLLGIIEVVFRSIRFHSLPKASVKAASSLLASNVEACERPLQAMVLTDVIVSFDKTAYQTRSVYGTA